MALTEGQKAWLTEQVGQTYLAEREGKATSYTRDGEDYVYRIVFSDGETQQRFVDPVTPPGGAKEYVGTELMVGVEGLVQEWREIADSDDEAELLVASEDGKWSAWERVEVPKSEEEENAEKAEKDSSKQMLLDRISAARDKGADRTPEESTQMLDDLASLIIDNY